MALLSALFRREKALKIFINVFEEKCKHSKLVQMFDSPSCFYCDVGFCFSFIRDSSFLLAAPLIQVNFRLIDGFDCWQYFPFVPYTFKRPVYRFRLCTPYVLHYVICSNPLIVIVTPHLHPPTFTMPMLFPLPHPPPHPLPWPRLTG